MQITRTQAKAACDLLIMLLSLEDQMTPLQRDKLDAGMDKMGDALITLSRYAASAEDQKIVA